MTQEFLAKSRIPGIFFQTLIRGSCLPINGGQIYISPDESINQSIYLTSPSQGLMSETHDKMSYPELVLLVKAGYENYFSRRLL